MKHYWVPILLAFSAFSCRSTKSGLNSDESLMDFRNYSGSIVCPKVAYKEVSDVSGIQDVVRMAKAEGRTIRAVSLDNSRSYSQVLCPEQGGILLNVKGLNRLLSVDKEGLRAVVQPGIMVKDLNNQLHPQGLTYPVMPDYTEVSLAGGLGTGAHHSSLNMQSGMADWVEQMKVVDGNGELQVLSGDELNTGKVHLGVLGVVVELTIKLRPQFKVQYAFEKISDKGLEDKFEGLVREHLYTKLLWFPRRETVIVESFSEVPLDTPGESYNVLWSATQPKWFEEVQKLVVYNQQRLAEIARLATFAAPIEDVGSKGNQKFVGFSHMMIAGGCGPALCDWSKKFKTRTLEVGIPLRRAKEWMADVRSIVAKKEAHFPLMGIYLRFSKASEAALAESYGEDTMVFEIHIPVRDKPYLEPSSDVYSEMVQMTLQKYDGRPHWAKNNPPIFQNLDRRQYPRWDEFEKLRTKMDPAGVFISPFWQKISSKAKTENYPNCAVENKCFCQNDADCGAGVKCTAGAVFTDVKVCRL